MICTLDPTPSQPLSRLITKHKTHTPVHPHTHSLSLAIFHSSALYVGYGSYVQRTAIVNFAHTFCAVAVARVQLKPKHDTRHVRACVHACVRACLCACVRARQTIRHQTAHHTRTPLRPSHERPTSNAHLHQTLARRLGTPDWMLHESIKPVTMRRIVMHFHCDTPNKHAHTRAHARTHTHRHRRRHFVT